MKLFMQQGRCGQRFCISNKLSNDAAAAALTHLQKLEFAICVQNVAKHLFPFRITFGWFELCDHHQCMCVLSAVQSFYDKAGTRTQFSRFPMLLFLTTTQLLLFFWEPFIQQNPVGFPQMHGSSSIVPKQHHLGAVGHARAWAPFGTYGIINSFDGARCTLKLIS